MNEKQRIFLELFEPLKERLWHFCLNLERNRDDAKDLLSESIESSFKSFDSLKSHEAFFSYLCTTALRAHLKIKKKRSNFIGLESIDWESLVADTVSHEKKAEINELYSALDKLPNEQKESIILQEIMGFSQIEICQMQNITIDALKQRLHRGKKKLRELLSDEPKFLEYSELKISGELSCLN